MLVTLINKILIYEKGPKTLNIETSNAITYNRLQDLFILIKYSIYILFE